MRQQSAFGGSQSSGTNGLFHDGPQHRFQAPMASFGGQQGGVGRDKARGIQPNGMMQQGNRRVAYLPGGETQPQKMQGNGPSQSAFDGLFGNDTPKHDVPKPRGAELFRIMFLVLLHLEDRVQELTCAELPL